MTGHTDHGAEEAAQRKRVLIVDDDPILREVMAGQLGTLALDVTQAEDGETALVLTATHRFDLAVVDISMPKLDGFGLLRHIRQHPKSADLPVIVATASGDRESIEKAYELGASSFVTKPVNWPQFAHHAQFVMRAGETERALRYAELEALAASRMKNGLFQMLSHELKTPLAALIGLTDVLTESLRNRIDRTQAEHLEHVVGAAGRLNLIINDILTLSRALAGRSRLQFLECPMREIVDDSIVGLKAKARARHVNLVTRQPAESLACICDPNLLRQALYKLIDNAIKFSPPGGTVEIWAHGKEDGSAVISVRDAGPGLSRAALDECLKPLIQNDMSYGRVSEGMGLGLPIARAIATAHDGQLIVRTSPGEGLVAAIWLPNRTPAQGGANEALEA